MWPFGLEPFGMNRIWLVVGQCLIDWCAFGIGVWSVGVSLVCALSGVFLVGDVQERSFLFVV